jgi:hypothetical protein
MTKKHFKLLARCIAVSFRRWDLAANGPGVLAIRQLADDMACELERTEPRFDKARFLHACDMTEL